MLLGMQYNNLYYSARPPPNPKSHASEWAITPFCRTPRNREGRGRGREENEEKRREGKLGHVIVDPRCFSPKIG